MQKMIILLTLCSCALPLKRNEIDREKPKESENQYGNLTHGNACHGKKNSDQLHLAADQEHIDGWKDYFRSRGKEIIERATVRGNAYRPIVEKIFKEEGLPEDLYYLAIIESGYQTHARGRAKAVGPWQFIYGTGKKYGLKIDRSVDERRHIIKSTRAAAKYLKDLHNIFHDWSLALSAYNAGEYRIVNAIRYANSRSFQELSKRRIIPLETRMYVPKFIAAKQVIEEDYQEQTSEKKYPEDLVIYNLKVPTSLKRLAKHSGLSVEQIKRFDHDIKGRYLPKYRSGHQVYLPQESLEKLNLIDSKKLAIQLRRPKKVRSKIHRVRRGQNLISIARRYGVSLLNLKRANNIKGTRLIVGQKLRIPRSATDVKGYIVKKGDSLHKISNKFGVSLNALKRVNSLTSNKIYPKQRIRIPI